MQSSGNRGRGAAGTPAPEEPSITPLRHLPTTATTTTQFLAGRGGAARGRAAAIVLVALLASAVPCGAAQDSCMDPDSPNYLDCCEEYGVALKPHWVTLLSSAVFVLLLLGAAATARCCGCIEEGNGEDMVVAHTAEEYVEQHEARLLEGGVAARVQDYMGMTLLENGVLVVQAVLAIANGIMIAGATSHLTDWDRYQAMVFLGANSTLGGFSAALLASAAAFAVTDNLMKPPDITHLTLEENEYPMMAATWDYEAAMKSRMKALGIYGVVTMVCGGGFFFCALITHVVPGMIVFVPFTILLHGALFLSAEKMTNVKSYDATIEAMREADRTGIPQELEDPAGPKMTQFQRLYVKILAPVSSVFMCTFYFGSLTTMMFQMYSGIRWDEAIVNDWNARSADKYFACVERQLAGTAGDSSTAIFDFLGIFL